MTLPYFETERLNMNLASLDDADFFITLFNSPGWIKYIGDRNVHTTQESIEYIKTKMLPQQEELGYGNYVMSLKSDGTKIGTVGIYNRPNLEDQDIGFSLLGDYMGKGYAYEAASKLLDLAMNTMGFKRMTAVTTNDNISSQKLIEKLGLKYEQVVDWPGDDAILWRYGINKIE